MNMNERTNERTIDRFNVFVCLKYLFRFRDSERGRAMEKEKAKEGEY